MKLVRRCTFCDSIWVDWNIKLEMTNEPVYAHHCYECGRIHLTSHWVHAGMPYPFLAIAHRVRMAHKSR